MGIFNQVWNFNLIYRVEISFWLNSKLFLKMTLRRNFNLAWKLKIFHKIDIFRNQGWKSDSTHARISCIFKKKKDYDFPARFKWTKDKLINLLKCLQEFKWYDSKADKFKLYEKVKKRLAEIYEDEAETFGPVSVSGNPYKDLGDVLIRLI